jgi:PAS domain S-box-containing protein
MPGQFLHFTGGEPSMNLMKIVHPMLRVELRAALFRAAQTSVQVEVFRVPLELGGKPVAVDIRVGAGAGDCAGLSARGLCRARAGGERSGAGAAGGEPAVRHLEREIEQMKTRLRDTIEQYEVSCEELKASNEELQAMNEELRSSAEELETSREELQSVNEELTTVNQELKSKVDDLGHSNADLANLMAATGVATIFLDRQLAITRYTPSAVTLFRLIASDLGRPLTDLNHQLNYPELKGDAQRVLETLVPVKREVSDGEGHWYLAQLLPYRTAEDRIAGVVLTFVDITETRQAEQARNGERDAAPAGRGRGAARRFRVGLALGSVGSEWALSRDVPARHERGPRRHRAFAERIHPDDQARVRSALEKAFAPDSAGRYEIEFRAILADGTERWIAANGPDLLRRHRRRAPRGARARHRSRHHRAAAGGESLEGERRASAHPGGRRAANHLDERRRRRGGLFQPTVV